MLDAGKGLGKEAGRGPTYNVDGTAGAGAGRVRDEEFDPSAGEGGGEGEGVRGGYAGYVS